MSTESTAGRVAVKKIRPSTSPTAAGTAAAVNSALQRARSTLAARNAADRHPRGDVAQRQVLLGRSRCWTFMR